MRSDMHQHVCTIRVLKIPIGSKVLVCRRHLGIVQYPAHLSVASGACTSAFGLHADHGIPIVYTRYHDLSLIQHGCRHAVLSLTRWIAPCIDHLVLDLRTQCIEERLIFLFTHKIQSTAVLHDLTHSGPPELRDRFALHDRINKLFPISRRVDLVTCITHPV